MHHVYFVKHLKVGYKVDPTFPIIPTQGGPTYRTYILVIFWYSLGPSQVAFNGELLVTVRAAVWPVTCMCSFMHDQVVFISEILFTFRAAIELFTCVCSFMYDQVVFVSELLFTFGAAVWLVTCLCHWALFTANSLA